MRAIVADGPDRLAWQEVPTSQLDRGEVLIKVAAAGVNRADLLQAAGNYPPPPGASQILGLEVSGASRRWATGHRVVGRASRSALCWPAAVTPNASPCPPGR